MFPMAPVAVAVPQAGYSYGVVLDELPMAEPVMAEYHRVAEEVVPMTYVPPAAPIVDAVWSMPAYEPIPMAVPIELPAIPMGTTIANDDGANDANWSADGQEDTDPEGGSDDDAGCDDDDGQDDKFDEASVPMATPIAVTYVDPIPLPMGAVVVDGAVATPV